MLDRLLSEIPILVIDLETTGVDARNDEIVEIGAVLVPPRGRPRRVLDTLVRPTRRIRGTEVHGITDADVADAPSFVDLGAALVSLSANRLVVGHNVSFDLRFLREAFADVGADYAPPHLCTCALMGTLGLGSRWSLAHACGHLGVTPEGAHAAADDALATAELLRRQLRRLGRRNVRTPGELLGADPRHTGLGLPPVAAPRGVACTDSIAVRPRGRADSRAARRSDVVSYRRLVLAAVEDLVVDAEEIAMVRDARERLGLSPPEWRTVHAEVLSAMLRRYCEDRRVDDDEAEYAGLLVECLRGLGWAPGDRPR